MSDSGPAPTERASPALSTSQMRWLMSGLMVGLALSSIEQSVISTALPTIAGELGSANQIAWVVSAYLLTSTIVTPLYGKMSDLYGRRIVYQTAIWMFLIGSVLCGLAPNMSSLVAARAVQGLGGGGLLSLAFVIVGDVVSPRQRGRWIGLFTSIFTISAIIGPLLGGLLVDGPGWRWVFWSVLPIGGVALVITSRGLRLPFATREPNIDWAGIALLVVAATSSILVPTWGGNTFAWSSAPMLVTIAVAIFATIAFIVVERQAVEPIIPMRLFRDRTSAAVCAMGFLLMGTLLATLTFLPFFLQVATGRSATRSGMMLIPESLGISLAATTAGWLTTRTGRYKWALVIGPVIASCSLLWLTTIDPGIGVPEFTIGMFVLGAGLGFVFPNMTLTIQNAARFEDLGIATSTANFFRSMGGAFGAAVGGAIVATRLDSELLARLGRARYDTLGGADELIRSPDLVRDLPVELREPVAAAVTDSVVAIFWRTLPFMLLIAVVALLVRETALRTSSAIGGDDTDS